MKETNLSIEGEASWKGEGERDRRNCGRDCEIEGGIEVRVTRRRLSGIEETHSPPSIDADDVLVR